MRDDFNPVPIVLGIAFLLFAIYLSGGLSAPQLPPTKPVTLDAPEIPQSVKDAAANAVDVVKDKLPPMPGNPTVDATAEAQGQTRFAIEDYKVTRVDANNIHVHGMLMNPTKNSISFNSESVQINDSAGVHYSVPIKDTIILQAGQFTTLDLDIPLPSGRQLMITVRTVEGNEIVIPPETP